MIPVMTRLKIHHMAEGGVRQADIAAKCGVSLRSVERVLTESEPTLNEVVAGAQAGAKRVGRPPKADDALARRVRELLEAEPKIMATEVLRRAHEWGYTGSKSAMSALVKRLRPIPKQEPVIRFEGLPGEYAQFDFGEVKVQYSDGTSEKLIFFAGRLKFSRLVHVVLVPNQQAETLIRALLTCLAAFGGSPKEWVFDNPKTVRVSRIGVEPVVLHPYLRELVVEYRVIPTLCAPRSGNQKGSVERLVGYAKKSFFLARKFRDRADVEAQLATWLHEVNHHRPCDATGVIPAVALLEEVPWLSQRPVRVSAADYPIRESAVVTPMGTISLNGTSYFATATRLGAPATVYVRRDTVQIVVGDEDSTHDRKDRAGVVQRLPGQRQDLLAQIHGRRKIATAKRQMLLDLGQPAWAFLTQLVHRCPKGRWELPCSELYELLVEHDDAAMVAAFADCVARNVFTVADVAAVLRSAA